MLPQYCYRNLLVCKKGATAISEQCFSSLTKRVVLPKPGPVSNFIFEDNVVRDENTILLEERQVEVQVAGGLSGIIPSVSHAGRLNSPDAFVFSTNSCKIPQVSDFF